MMEMDDETRLKLADRLFKLEYQNRQLTRLIADLEHQWIKKDVIPVCIDDEFNEEIYSAKASSEDTDITLNLEILTEALKKQLSYNEESIITIVRELYLKEKI